RLVGSEMCIRDRAQIIQFNLKSRIFAFFIDGLPQNTDLKKDIYLVSREWDWVLFHCIQMIFMKA
uniref:hypothetical protein n=1 Tax=Helicobacter typhlonius TaxID=76936 RepID=UPI002FE1256B